MARLQETIRRPALVAAGIVLAAIAPAFAKVPENLRVEGVPENHRVLSVTPSFCWDVAGRQTNWQIQVDDDPGYTPNRQPGGVSVWFWDSGTGDKGDLAGARCVTMRQVTDPALASRNLDRRPHEIYWRVRVARAGEGWGPWAASTLRMNQHPLMPERVIVEEDGRPSAEPAGPQAVAAAGRTLYVAPSGDDDANGTELTPFRTLSHALTALRPGDTLLVRGGLYEENLMVAGSAGHASGEPGRPIIVRAAAGETPILRSVQPGSGVALQVGPDPQLSDWIFDGLTIGGVSTLTGVHVTGVTSIAIRNCRWEGNLPREATLVSVGGGSEGVRISGCRFDESVREQIEVGAASDVEIRDNEFTNFNGSHAIWKRGDAGGGLTVVGNRFHDSAPVHGAVALGAGSAGARVAGNVFSRIMNPASGHAVVVYRSGGVTVENNVFHDIAGSAVRLNEMSLLGTYSGNIFANCGTGIEFRGGVVDGSSTAGAAVDYNLFHGNGRDLDTRHDDPGLMRHAPAGNCFGGSAEAGTTCDPRFVDAGRGDFRLAAGSPAIDAGDPEKPVPAGGGRAIDAGAYEFGSADLSQSYRPAFSVTDSTPRFRWQTNDPDNVLAGPRSGSTDHQGRLQIQIDTVSTFDSRGGGRPLFDSGQVVSTVEGYTLPEPHALAPGDYHVRVRQWDNRDSTRGAWSDGTLTFRVEASGAPVASGGAGRR